MSTKKKILLTAMSLVLALAITCVAVYASLTVNHTSSFDFSFTSKDVSAEISIWVDKYTNSATVSPVYNSSHATSLILKPASSTSTQLLTDFSPITLNARGYYYRSVYYVYFVNKGSRDFDINYTQTLAIDGTAGVTVNNLTVTRAYCTGTTAYNKVTENTWRNSSSYSTWPALNNGISSYVNCATYVLMKIEFYYNSNLSNNSSMTTNFHFAYDLISESV